MYTYSTYATPSTSSALTTADLGVWGIIVFVLAIIGGILGYFLFVQKKNTFKGFLKWAHNFLNFKTLFIEGLMKIGYMMMFIFVTLGSFGLISTSFIAFLVMLIGGNLALRVCYEFVMLTLILVKNTTEINDKLGDDKKK